MNGTSAVAAIFLVAIAIAGLVAVATGGWDGDLASVAW